ncbi:hypothetical protein KQH82_04845 [bacterium]|nr:hypothetical protein [bacterium]
MKRFTILSAALLAAAAICSVDVAASDAEQLHRAYLTMEQVPTAPSVIYDVTDFSLTRQDFALHVESGRIYFFAPITINDTARYWGALFRGKALFQFAPSLDIEQNQLQLFFETDSLNRPTSYSVLLLNDSLAGIIRQNGTPVTDTTAWDKDSDGKLKELYAHLTRNESKMFLFETLRNLAFPQRRPFLLVDADLNDAVHVIYRFNPAYREEVALLKDYKRFFVSFFMEEVCSYSVYADPTYRKINGINRERIKPRHYAIESEIESGGMMRCKTDMQFEALLSETQLLLLHLNDKAEIDSIVDGDGNPLPFLRYSDWANRNDSLYLFLNHPLQQGEVGSLTFYYGGKIVERREGIITVEAGTDWYPRHGLMQRATFDLRFSTPKVFSFIASGELTEDRETHDTRFSRWVVRDPMPAASFTIGEFEKYDYATDVAPIELYISETLKRDVSRSLPDSKKLGGRQMRQRVAEDVSGALKLFTHYFGPYRLPRLIVSETLVPYGESQPGIVQLNWDAVHLADMWGEQRLRRANLVARQWWGNGVLIDSYRDRWLTESFASYSALLYLQAAEGNDRLFWWLKEYRKQIESMARFVGSERTQSVPIALGHRVNSTETNFVRKDVEPLAEAGLATINTLQEHRSTVEIEDFSTTLYGSDDDPKNDQAGVVRFRRTPAEILGGQELATASGQEARIDTSISLQEISIYRKGAYVLHMLRNMLMDLQTLDDSRFFDMMTEWHEIFYGRRATTDDFRRLTEKYCGMDMGWFFEEWVYGYYLPVYKFSYEVTPTDDGLHEVVCDISQSGVPDGFKMFVPIEIEFKGGGKAYVRLLIDKPQQRITLPPLDKKPNRITLNPFESVLARVEQ